MRIFIAGASGAIGGHLVTLLAARGHEVIGTTRSAARTGMLRALGAAPVAVDALDPDAAARAEPEVIVHQLSALSGPTRPDARRETAAAGARPAGPPARRPGSGGHDDAGPRDLLREDQARIVQEAFLRLHQTTRRGETIASPRAYVATLVTRLSIDELRSARPRRERYVGEWLPEPPAGDPSPGDRAETADALSLAVLMLLESLTPQQRAAFLLREVFQYPSPEVAEVVGTDVDTTRHPVARARDHLRNRRPRYHATRRQRQRLARRFFAAVEEGDLPTLKALRPHPHRRSLTGRRTKTHRKMKKGPAVRRGPFLI